MAAGPKQALQVGSVELSAKEGIYVTVSDRNGLVDAGVRAETQAAFGNLQLSGPGVAVSFVSGAVTFQ